MFEVLYAVDPYAVHIGYLIIKKVSGHPTKIEGSTLYETDEYDEAVAHSKALNEAEAIKAHWPAPNDVDVVKLLNDRSFDPGETNYESSVIDEEASNLVLYLDDDEYTQIDWDKSEVVYKDIKLDSPVSTVQRTHKAQETVARNRAGLQIG